VHVVGFTIEMYVLRCIVLQTSKKLIADFGDFANAIKNLVPASQQECLYVIRTD
jgi:hypothetical protein